MTTVDDLCARAGVTKGAFFNYFKTKGAWSRGGRALVGGHRRAVREAHYHSHEDPLDRVLAYIDFRRSLLRRDISEFTCAVGTMVQETYGLHPNIRDACAANIFGHAGTLVDDIEVGMAEHGVVGDWTAQSLAAHPKLCCKARSFWPRPRTTWRWPSRAWSTCGARGTPVPQEK